MDWLQRDCTGKSLYIIYRFVMLMYNSFWYYFAPFLWKLGTFLWILKKNHALAELLAEDGGEGGEGGESHGNEE